MFELTGVSPGVRGKADFRGPKIFYNDHPAVLSQSKRFHEGKRDCMNVIRARFLIGISQYAFSINGIE
jgi:hypothetical protein